MLPSLTPSRTAAAWCAHPRRRLVTVSSRRNHCKRRRLRKRLERGTALQVAFPTKHDRHLQRLRLGYVTNQAHGRVSHVVSANVRIFNEKRASSARLIVADHLAVYVRFVSKACEKPGRKVGGIDTWIATERRGRNLLPIVSSPCDPTRNSNSTLKLANSSSPSGMISWPGSGCMIWISAEPSSDVPESESHETVTFTPSQSGYAPAMARIKSSNPCVHRRPPIRPMPPRFLLNTAGTG